MQKITVNNKSFFVDPTDYEYFWPQVNGGGWEPDTYQVFDENIDNETLVIDIGAWIGPTALYSAQLAKKCIAFEPDPIAFPRLKENVDLNKAAPWGENITVYDKAISPEKGEISFGSQQGGGDSMSSVLFAESATSWIVEAITLEDVFAEHSAPDQKIFLKIDIEGGEFDLVPEIKKQLADPRVTAYISLHPHFLRRSLKKSVGTFLFIPRFIKTRLQFLRIYKKLIAALPRDKKVTINGKEYTNYTWFLLHAFLRLRTPSDILISHT
jgi:FkbM family methyltransferase